MVMSWNAVSHEELLALQHKPMQTFLKWHIRTPRFCYHICLDFKFIAGIEEAKTCHSDGTVYLGHTKLKEARALPGVGSKW